MTTIKEIQRIAAAGFIEDPERVAKAVDDFANMEMGPVFACSDKKVRGLFNCLANMHQFYNEVIDHVSYIELMSMIENLDNVMETDGDMTASQFKRFHIHFTKRIILDAGKRDAVVKCFLAVKLGALRDYLNGKHENNLVIGWFDRMQSDYNSMLHGDGEDDGRDMMDLTVAELLQQTSKCREKAWLGWNDFSIYWDMINSAYAVETKLFRNIFLTAYREKLDERDLYTKYLEYYDLSSNGWDDIEYDDIIEDTDGLD